MSRMDVQVLYTLRRSSLECMDVGSQVAAIDEDDQEPWQELLKYSDP